MVNHSKCPPHEKPLLLRDNIWYTIGCALKGRTAAVVITVFSKPTHMNLNAVLTMKQTWSDLITGIVIILLFDCIMVWLLVPISLIWYDWSSDWLWGRYRLLIGLMMQKMKYSILRAVRWTGYRFVMRQSLRCRFRTPACALKQGTLSYLLHLWTEM